MTERGGTVYIAPSAFKVPPGRMVDPETSLFWVSWQDETRPGGGLIEWRDDIVGAEAAIAWGRERADVVLIRLGHTGDTYFSAGELRPDEADPDPMPPWPPLTPPSDGWFTPPADDY